MVRRYGKIIIVEGVWGSGKTAIIRLLKKSLEEKVVIINEPNHLTSISNRTTNEVTRWYMKAHYKNISRALALTKENRFVLIERSPLSSITFAQVYLKKPQIEIREELSRFRKKIEEIKKLNKGEIVVIFLSNTKRSLSRLRSRSYLKHLANMSSILSVSKEIKKELSKLEKEELIKLFIDPKLKILIKNL